MTEAWLRGPLEGVPVESMPAAHALVQAKEEIVATLARLSTAQLHASPGAAASIAFHVRHLCGSTDRLLTYARGEALSEPQLAALEAEKQPAPKLDGSALIALIDDCISRALAQIQSTDPATLDDPREVGRGKLPSTVRGLLFHAAEHAARHTGQIRTTLRLLEGK